MKVVSSYDSKRKLADIPNMEGRDFKSFNAALDALKPGQGLTLELPDHWYKNVGIDENGRRWVQRHAVTEY